jgi:glyoxylase-like metal-dependent hydrolase (beta-lactamase superfamily II)/ferredoxin
MANAKLRLPENVPGDFYVDETCIDCDACRQIAPETFRDHGDQSSVYQQPTTADAIQRALMALVACPTGSIGTTQKHDLHPAIDTFPVQVDANIHFCGFTAESSFGAWSYLITRPPSEGGNVLVDSPRWAGQLVKKIEAMGGITNMLLTHSDDIADHARYAERFNTRRLMHADDGAARRGIEQVMEGNDPVAFDSDITIIPTPGHTRGHIMFLYRDTWLFTGDSLAWKHNGEGLTAFRYACWYSWERQIESLRRLLDYRFEWVIPGHGRIGHAPAHVMREYLERCVEWMVRVGA